MPKIFSLLSAQGTACVETTLNESDLNNVLERGRVERMAALDERPDAPVVGTWTDVTENTECQDWLATS